VNKQDRTGTPNGPCLCVSSAHFDFVSGETDPTGGDQPHNNMMPYLGVYIWERIA
jgi:microcystin-dependent protein